MTNRFIQEVRAFNRFYTNVIGLLDRHILKSRFSLPEVRVLFELFHNPGLSASGITNLIEIDKGYLSRILSKLTKRGLVAKSVSSRDSRMTVLELTAKGKKEFSQLNEASDNQIRNIFKNMTTTELEKLSISMLEIQQIIHRNVDK